MKRRLAWMILFATLFALGVGMTLASGELDHTSIVEVVGGFTGVLIGLLPPVARRLKRFADWLEALPTGRHVVLIGFLILLLPIDFYLTARLGGRPLVPLMHDEQMYLLQARQLASFHLAMPALPMGDFFETFYVLVRPAYASMYFPGTALAYVPAIWLNLPYCVWPIAVMTALFVATYLVAERMFGRFFALLTVGVMLPAPLMTWMPTATMGHPLGALLGMLVVYGWLRWREAQRIGWVLLIGIATGWLMITRPMESFCFTLPVAIAVLGSIRRDTAKRIALHIAVVVACTLPFIALQLADDYAVTGHWLKLPITLYIEQEFPHTTAMGTSPVDVESKSALPQKQDMVKAFIRPVAILDHSLPLMTKVRNHFVIMLSNGISSALLFPLLALAIALTARVEVRVLLAGFVLFNVCYVIYNGYNAQYTIQMTPTFSILIVGGVTGLIRLFSRRGTQLMSLYTFGLLGVSAVVLAIMPHSAVGGEADWKTIIFNYTDLPKTVKQPALVLFHYGPGNSPFAEPVYNLEAATPDDCPIIRAHDLGQRNIELFKYYAAKQPQRKVYLFDRVTHRLQSLGTVAELAKSSPAAQ